jgi:carbonic anhydrase
MTTQTKESQNALSHGAALELLKEGNQRFLESRGMDRDLLGQVAQTSKGQFPYATVLSCIDSRVPVETVFDQGIGDVFSIRIAGNFVNDDILGSMEFACKLAGSKVILVLGHTSCGAVKGACDHAEMGHLTGMLKNIEPAVNAVKEPENEEQRNSSNIDFVNAVAAQNVKMTVEEIKRRSEILREMEKADEISIIGGIYEVETGKILFF